MQYFLLSQYNLFRLLITIVNDGFHFPVNLSGNRLTVVLGMSQTMPLPEKDEMFLTKGKMLEDIMVSLGGRIAEVGVTSSILA